MEFFQYPIAFLVALGVLVAVHEFGHFWAARRIGVRVERFSVGFGPVLYRKKDALGTEFCLSAIPLGGYVKLLDARADQVSEADLPQEFSSRPPLQKIFVYAAGPLINLGFAALLYCLLFMVGVVRLVPIVDEVLPGSYAERAALAPGDEIKAIDGAQVTGWEQVSYALVAKVGDKERLDMVVVPQGSELQLTRSVLLEDYRLDQQSDPIEAFGIVPSFAPRVPLIGSVARDSVAAAAGMQVGDLVVRVDGEDIEAWDDLVTAVQPRAGETIRLELMRQNEMLELTMVPSTVFLEDGSVVGRLGVGPDASPVSDSRWVKTYRYGPVQAFKKALSQTWDMTCLILVSIKKMLVGDIALDNLSGPITIAQVAGDTVSYGLEPFLNFLAYLSISLGVLNLLPIPMLDGGHIAYTLIELLRGRPVSEKAQALGFKVGLTLIIGFMLVAFYNDIARLMN